MFATNINTFFKRRRCRGSSNDRRTYGNASENRYWINSLDTLSRRVLKAQSSSINKIAEKSHNVCTKPALIWYWFDADRDHGLSLRTTLYLETSKKAQRRVCQKKLHLRSMSTGGPQFAERRRPIRLRAMQSLVLPQRGTSQQRLNIDVQSGILRLATLKSSTQIEATLALMSPAECGTFRQPKNY